MQHADKLTDGQMKAFESYADYRIDVYPSSAECRIPDAVRAVSGSNSSMVNGNEGIEWNTLGGKPFPNPTEAQHYIWNHRSAPHYNASIHRTLVAYIVKNDGTATIGKGDNYIEFPGALDSPLRGQVDPNIYALYMVKNMSPARIAGTLTMLHIHMIVQLSNVKHGNTVQQPVVCVEHLMWLTIHLWIKLVA
jgi:hypothetical protein